jgi:hypothetical protein
MVLGGVWVVAGATKVTDLDASVRAVLAYRLLPEPVAVAVGAGLPLAEIECGCFGSGGDLVPGQEPRYGTEMIRDAGLLLLAGWLAGRPESWVTVDAVLMGRVPEQEQG